MNRFLGALSVVPLFASILFLPFHLNTSILPYLSRVWRTVAMHTIIPMIPAIVVLDELASFYGVSHAAVSNYRSGQTMTDAFAQPIYTSALARIISLTFTTTALTLLIVITLLTLVLCLRLLSHVQHISELGGSIPGVTFGSTVLFATGVFLSALEYAFGLIPAGSFGTILARRIIAALGRTCVIAALILCVVISLFLDLLLLAQTP